MRLTLVYILIAVIPVAYCYSPAFEDLVETGSEYCFIWAFMTY